MSDRNVEVSIDFSTPAYAARIVVGPHRIVADEPAESGGGDTGPAPTQLLLSALGACTSITLRMYAEHKQWPVKSLRVELSYAERSPGKTVIERKVHVQGELSDEQRARLLQVANACPVHKILTGTIEIPTELE